jgi:hypothetical protein
MLLGIFQFNIPKVLSIYSKGGGDRGVISCFKQAHSLTIRHIKHIQA